MKLPRGPALANAILVLLVGGVIAFALIRTELNKPAAPTPIPITPTPTPAPHPALVQTLIGHNASVSSVVFAPDSQTLASGGEDALLRLWRVGSALPSGSFPSASDDIVSIAFSPDGQLMAAGTNRMVARVWRIPDSAVLTDTAVLERHTQTVSFSPLGDFLVTAGNFGRVSLYSLPDIVLAHKLETETDWTYVKTAFSPDGKSIMAVSSNGFLSTWRIGGSNKPQAQLQLAQEVDAVAFSADVGLVAIVLRDGTVELRQVADGSLRRTLKIPESRHYALTFSPAGNLIAMSDEVYGINLYSVADGTLMARLNGHTSLVNALDFSPDGRLLASGSDDTTVRIWDVPRALASSSNTLP